MPISIRPEGSEGPRYSPHRDLAFITPTIMRAAIDTLDEANWSAAKRHFFDAVGVTAHDLGEASYALAGAQKFFVEAVDVMDHEQALRIAGFGEVNTRAQEVVFATLGQALVTAWFHGVREATRIGEVPHSTRDMAQFEAHARWIAERLGVQNLPPEVELLADRQEMNTIIIHNGLRLSKQANELLKLRSGIQAAHEQLKNYADETGRLQTAINLANQEGLWARLKRWWHGSPITTPQAAMPK